jgi:hypothetical protein
MVAAAQTSEPVAARGYLRQGFALKEQGRCNEAIPYFLESIRLDRQPTALLNLADCEERIGKLGAASMHFIEARDLAHAQGLEPPPPTVSVGLGTASQPGDDSPGLGQRIAGFSLMGVGAAGFVIGTIFGLKVPENNRDIDSICPTGEPCPSQSVALYNIAVADAKINRAASLIGFGVGAVFVGTGAVLVLTAPKRHASGVAIWLTPVLGSSGSRVECGGTW